MWGGAPGCGEGMHDEFVKVNFFYELITNVINLMLLMQPNTHFEYENYPFANHASIYVQH